MGLINICICTCIYIKVVRGNEDEGARLFSRVPTERTRGNRHKLKHMLFDSGRKGGSSTYGRKGRRLKRSTGVSLGCAERKLERQKAS